MNKKIALTTLAFAIIAPTSLVFAEENQQEVTSAQESQREQAKKALEVTREQNKQTLETQRETNKRNIEDKRETTKQGFEDQREQNKQEKRLEFQDKQEKMVEERCKNIETKIATRIGRYENNGKMLQNVYGHMQARLSRLIVRLDSVGADTAKLKADILILNGKIDKLKTDQAAFMATLKDSQTFVCGKSEGEFKGKLEQARKVPELIKQDREDIKNFFNTTIKADLQIIRKQLAVQKEAAEATETPEVKKTETPEAPEATKTKTPAVPTL